MRSLDRSPLSPLVVASLARHFRLPSALPGPISGHGGAHIRPTPGFQLASTWRQENSGFNLGDCFGSTGRRSQPTPQLLEAKVDNTTSGKLQPQQRSLYSEYTQGKFGLTWTTADIYTFPEHGASKPLSSFDKHVCEFKQPRCMYVLSVFFYGRYSSDGLLSAPRCMYARWNMIQVCMIIYESVRCNVAYEERRLIKVCS